MAQRLITTTIKNSVTGKTAKIGKWVGLPNNYKIPSKTNGIGLASAYSKALTNATSKLV